MGVLSKDVPIDPDRGVSARLYLPSGEAAAAAAAKLPIVVYFHGGAFCIESPFSPQYHRYLTSLAAAAGVVAVSVHYRLAPEHPLPAAYDDAWAALKWAASNAASGPEPWLAARGDLRRLFLAGDSAGANIAHNMAVRAAAKEEDLGFAIKGLVLMNPYFWGKDPVGEETRDAEVRARMESTWGFVCGGRYGIEHPFVDPWGSPRAWRELASERVLVTVSEMDLFRERGKAYAEGLEKSGWRGEVRVYETEGRITFTTSLSPTPKRLSTSCRSSPPSLIALDELIHSHSHSHSHSHHYTV
uniref:Alpha/beta hydrolase fold-3 domain-containing protein n=1 Tax=Ananas comosus var. bracteatus TaxID=296719 RepID=A0A6V7P5X9_ANACO|nr:unnamed protein product [Ananas comosus var. bracteatus]